MLGHIGLDQPAPGNGLAAGAARHLTEQLEGALGRARIGLREAEIAVDHADQSKTRKVMALGDELGADDDIDLALLDLAQGLAQIADARREIARQQHAARLGKALGDLLGDALDARAARHERMLGPAIRACLGDRHESPAMVAFEPAAESVLDQPGRAVRAFEFEAAFPAERHRRIAAAIEEQQRLLAARKRLGDRIDENGREPAPALGRIRAHVDGGDGGKAGRLVADAKPDVPVAALLGVDQALDRGRRRAQHDGATAERAPHHRHVARLIGDALLLLVALVVLLIDDDEAEIGEGQEQRRARADHELRLVLGHRPPDAAAQAAPTRRNAIRRAARRSAPRSGR